MVHVKRVNVSLNLVYFLCQKVTQTETNGAVSNIWNRFSAKGIWVEKISLCFFKLKEDQVIFRKRKPFVVLRRTRFKLLLTDSNQKQTGFQKKSSSVSISFCRFLLINLLQSLSRSAQSPWRSSPSEEDLTFWGGPHSLRRTSVSDKPVPKLYFGKKTLWNINFWLKFESDAETARRKNICDAQLKES